MKIIIVRHGDPDYINDDLTEKGHREAALVAQKIAPLPIRKYYVSVLGRAQRTYSYTQALTGREDAVTLDWLREFEGRCIRPDVNEKTLCWDWLPQDWTKESLFYDKDRWFEPAVIQNSNVKAEYDRVCQGLDEILAENGYEREKNGNTYRAIKPNNDTIALYCHFGVTCVMLSHLLGISPMVLWHGTVCAPTSVTTIMTEERREGVVSFRVNSFGDVGHLWAADEPVAFSGRFRECYTNDDERKD